MSITSGPKLKICKWISLLIVTFCTSNFSTAQTRMDSLRDVLSRLPVTFAADTHRVLLLVEMGREINNDKVAIDYLNQAMTLAQKTKWSRGIMIVTSRTGFHYGRMGFDYRACEYFFKALRLAELQKDNVWIGFAYRYLGDNHNDLGEFKKAIQFFDKSLPYLYKGKDYPRYLIAMHNKGLSYLALEKYDEAITVFKNVLDKNRTFKQKDVDVPCITNLSTAYEKKGDLTTALTYLNKLRELSSTNPDDVAYADIQIARILTKLGRIEDALLYANAANKIEGKVRINTIKSIHETLTKLYQNKGNYPLAFKHLSEFNALQMQNSADMQHKQIESLKFYYENEKQKADIYLLNRDVAEKERDKRFLTIWLYSVSAFVIVLSFAIFLINRKSKKIEAQRNQIRLIKEALDDTNQKLLELNGSLEQRVNERTSELMIANNELIAKNNEIKEAFFNGQSLERKRVASELHDNLGGTISALKWQFESIETERLTQQEKVIYENVLAMMEVAYADVRNISHNLIPAELEKQGLSVALKNLISDLNSNRRIHFEFIDNYVGGFLDKRKEMEVYGICMEVINNILKHSRATEASLNIQQIADNLLISISDNGVGMPQFRSESRNGMGLRNLQSRAEGINGEISIETNLPAGTLVRIAIYPDPESEPSGRGSA